MESNQSKPFSHYYGDLVRIIFVIGAVVILWGMPRISEILSLPIILPIIAVVILGITAGFTNPVSLTSMKINVMVSVVFLIIFSYVAWYSYTHEIGSVIEFANQAVAVLFLIASYFSVKSLRGAQTRSD